MKLYDDYFKEYIELFPSLNDSLNLKQFRYLNDKMEDNLDENHLQKQEKFYKKYLNKMNAIKNKKIYDKVLLNICQESLESFNYNFHLVPINHQENIISHIFEMATGEGIFIFKFKKDYSNFLKKIDIYPKIIESIIKNMSNGIKLHYTLPKILCIKLIEQLSELLKNKSYLNKLIKMDLNYDFNKKLEDILIEPTKQLLDFLRNIYLSKCRKSIGMNQLPNGKREYEFLVKCSTNQPKLKIKEIHEYGLKEVKRIFDAMNTIKKKLNFKGTLKEFNKFLRTDNKFKFKSKSELLKLYKNEIEKINDTIIKTNFFNNVKSKCDVIQVPKYNEKFAPEAYYMPCDLELKRNGKFYVNLRNIDENSKIEVESLTLHEVIPGHHYQISHIYEKQDVPLFIKTLDNDAYQEGWALYCEGLGDYDTYESFYGKLVMEMIRAIRLVVDTGMHYYNWSFNKTYNFYRKYAFDTEEQIKNELFRYIAIPTQALSYKIGEKFFHDKLKKFKGNIKEYHKIILDSGPIPLSILEERFI